MESFAICRALFFSLVKLAGEVSFKSDSFLLKLFFRLRVALKTRNFSLLLNFCMSRNKSSAIRKLLREEEDKQWHRLPVKICVHLSLITN